MGSKKKLVLASLVSLMMVLAFVIGLVPNHATLGARAASGGGGRVDMVDLLNAVLDLKSDSPVILITVSDPRTGAIIKVPADTIQASLAVRAVALGDAGNVAYGMDGTWEGQEAWVGEWFSGVTNEKPYRSSIDLLPAITAATQGVQTAHYIYALAEASVLLQGLQAEITYSLRSPGPADPGTPKQIFLEAMDASIDLNKNGIPDNIVDTVYDGETWLVTYRTTLYDDLGADVGTALRQTVVASLSDISGAKAAGVITVSPDPAVIITAPNTDALLENGLLAVDDPSTPADESESAFVIVSVVDNRENLIVDPLQALLTETNGLVPSTTLAWADGVNAKAPSGGQVLLASPTGAQRYVAISLVAIKADGSYREISEELPEGLSIDVAFRGLDIPADADVQLSAYPVKVTKPLAGYELTNLGTTQEEENAQFWEVKALRDPALLPSQQGPDEFVASLTRGSAVFAPFKVTMRIDSLTPDKGAVLEQTPTTILGDFGVTAAMTLVEAQNAYGVYFGDWPTSAEFSTANTMVITIEPGGLQALHVKASPRTTPGFVNVTVVDRLNPSDTALKSNGFKYMYKLTTAASPAIGGTIAISPAANGPLYDPSDSVTLTATAAAGYTFREWQINNGTALPPITDAETIITMDSNVTATAVFDVNEFTLTTTVSPGPQAGTIEKQPDQAFYAPDAIIGLIARAAAGYRFLNWTQDVSGTNPSTSIIMDGNKNVTANFAEIPTYRLDKVITPEGSGTITVTPDPTRPPNEYEAGTLLTLTAVPSPGYDFSSWGEGVIQDLVNPRVATVTITGNMIVTATFVKVSTITLLSSTGGHVKGNDGATINPGPLVKNNGDEFTLIAVADAQYSFARWEDGAGSLLGSNGTYVLTVTADLTIKPVFTFNGWLLNTSVLPGPAAGSIVKDPDLPAYPTFTTVSLVAHAAAGYRFNSWSGNVADTTLAATSIYMEKNENVTATFQKIWTITLLGSTGGHVMDGANILAPGSYSPVPDGYVKTLEAVSDARYTFLRWEDGAGNQLVTTAVYTFTVTSDLTIKPVFSFNGFTLATSVLPVGAGTIDKLPDQPLYALDTVVTLQANSSAGYIFTSWNGATADPSDPTKATVTITADTTVTANFTVVQPENVVLKTIVSPPGWGTVTPAGETQHPISATVPVGLLAQAAAGYQFYEWTGNVVDTLNASTSIYMTQDETVTATFEVKKWTVTLLPSTGGYVIDNTDDSTIAPGDHVVPNGTPVTIKAIPDAGYGFVKWEDGAGNELSTDAIYAFTVTSDLTIMPIFSELTYMLTTSVIGGNGTLAPLTGPQTQNAVVNLLATPATGYQVKTWTGTEDNTLKTNTNTVRMSSAKTVTVEFEVSPTYILTIDINPVGAGTVTTDLSAPYLSGTVVTLTANPAALYRFKSWTNAIPVATDPTKATVTIANANVTVTALFELIPTYTLTVNIDPVGAGTVTAVPTGPSYMAGTTVTLTANANSGYTFLSWADGAVAVPGAPLSATVTIGTANATVSAHFAPAKVTLTTRVVPLGSGTVNGDQPGLTQWDKGQTVELLAKAEQGYEFESWTGNVANALNASTNIIMNADEIVTANFKKAAVWTVTLIQSTGGHVVDETGAIIAPGSYLYPNGTEATLIAVPDAAYSFVEWQDGERIQLSANATYIFTVKADVAIKPIFASNQVVINSITPGEAWLFGGVVAKIQGQGFKRNSTLTFNDLTIAPANRNFIDSTLITFVVPPLAEQLAQTEFNSKPTAAPDAQPSISVTVEVSNGANQSDTSTFQYKRYDVDVDSVVTTAFQVTYSAKATTSKYIPFALDGVANNLGIFPTTTNGADFTLPQPNTAPIRSTYGLIRAAKRPTTGASPLLTNRIDSVAGQNSRPVANAWDFSIHFYDSAVNPAALQAGLNQTGVVTGLHDELAKWVYDRKATGSGKIAFPTDDTALTVGTMAKGVTTWATETTFDYGAQPAAELAGPALNTPYQSTVLRNEYVTGTAAADRMNIKQLTVRVYDFSAFSLRTGRTNNILNPAHVRPLESTNLNASLTGGSILHIHSDNGGMAWTRVGFHKMTKAGETVAGENIGLVKQWDPDTSLEIDGGRDEFDIYVKIPAYPNPPTGTTAKAGVSIYAIADLYPTGDDISGTPLSSATPIVVMTDSITYKAIPGTGPGWLPWLLGVVGLVAAIAVGIALWPQGNESASDGGGGGGPCFIATAAYGTPLAVDINTLRALRDTVLLTSTVGTAFVEGYYHVSPYVADFVAKSPLLASMVRVALVPVIMLSKVVMTAPVWSLSLGLAAVAALIARRLLSRKA